VRTDIPSANPNLHAPFYLSVQLPVR